MQHLVHSDLMLCALKQSRATHHAQPIVTITAHPTTICLIYIGCLNTRLPEASSQTLDGCSDMPLDDTGYSGAAVVTKAYQWIVTSGFFESLTKLVKRLLPGDITLEPQISEGFPNVKVKELIYMCEHKATISLQILKCVATFCRHLVQHPLQTAPAVPPPNLLVGCRVPTNKIRRRDNSHLWNETNVISESCNILCSITNREKTNSALLSLYYLARWLYSLPVHWI